MRILGRAITRATVWAAGVFYRVERAGPELPHGPAIIVTNHPNMLMDPLLALKTAGRRVRILAKAPLFALPLFGPVLRSLDTLPLYRVQDDPDQLHRNRQAFREAVEALQGSGALLMFPEGKSHSQPALAPLKTGVARIALEAEEQSEWRLGVKVVPLGLAYQRKHRFRSRVVAGIGDAIRVAEWRDSYQSDRSAAIGSLTQAVAKGLAEQTLNLSEESDRRLVETADLLYARAKGWARWREREPWKERLPRLQRLADQFAWLRTHDPNRWDRLSHSLQGYGRWLKLLGSGEADVPPRYDARRVVRYVLRETVTLGVGLPLAALGMVVWYGPYFLTGLVCRVMKPEIETVATVKLLAALIFYPVAYLVWIVLVALVAGAPAAITAAIVLPPLGFATLYWHHRRQDVSEDVRTFFQVIRRPQVREALRDRRNILAGELDALAAEWMKRRGEQP